MMLLDLSSDRNEPCRLIALKFWTTYEPDPENPGKLKACDRVSYQRPGARGAVMSDKVLRIKSAGGHIWGALRAQYEAWKRNEAAPIDGTPIDGWPSISREIAAIFKRHDIRTVEDLAQMSDADLERLPIPQRQDYKRKARAYLEASCTKSEVEAKLSERDTVIAQLQAEMSAMRREFSNPPATAPAVEEAGIERAKSLLKKGAA